MASKSFLKLLNMFIKNKMNVDKVSEIYKQVNTKLYFPETIGKANTRVMLTQGDREPGFLKESNKELHKRFKNSECYTFRNSGHLYPFEEVSAFDSLCIRWIECCPS
jgi:pimeloyl-ACP methyl ester carboxylesterase